MKILHLINYYNIIIVPDGRYSLPWELPSLQYTHTNVSKMIEFQHCNKNTCVHQSY